MLTTVKQPLAWELCGDLWDLVRLRPHMQQEEWEYRFSDFWPHQLRDLSQSNVRQEMFDVFLSKGLAQRHYASELDILVAENEGWQAKIADLCLVCSAFPVCDIGVCHHRSIEHRKGYEDKNGRKVSSHQVRSFFKHRGRLSERQKDVHKAARDQFAHDTAIDTMIDHLLVHKSGFYVTSKCSKCKKDFEALRIQRSGDYKPKFREYDDQGNLKFEYDIGLVGEDGKLKAILEALNTHKMGEDKRKYVESKSYPWVEYSVLAMLLSNRNGSIHSKPDGWLELDALKLKIGHSGEPYCHVCAKETEREREDATKRERIRRKISDGEEARRKAMKEIIEPAERDIDQIIRAVECTDAGRSATSLNNMELELANAEVFERGIKHQLREVEQVITQLLNIESEVNSEKASRKDKSFCVKTGLELTTEFNEMIVNRFASLPLELNHVNNKCDELLALINVKRQELDSMREWLQ